MNLPQPAQFTSDLLNLWKDSPHPDVTPWIQAGDTIMASWALAGSHVTRVTGPHRTDSGEEGWHLELETLRETQPKETLPFCRHVGRGILVSPNGYFVSARDPEAKPRGEWDSPLTPVVWKKDSFQEAKIEVWSQNGKFLCDGDDQLLHMDQVSVHFQETKPGRKAAIAQKAREGVLKEKTQEVDLAMAVTYQRQTNLLLRGLAILKARLHRLEKEGDLKGLALARQNLDDINDDATAMPREVWEYLQELRYGQKAIPLGSIPNDKETIVAELAKDGKVRIGVKTSDGNRPILVQEFSAWEDRETLRQTCVEVLSREKPPKKEKTKPGRTPETPTEEKGNDKPPEPCAFFFRFSDHTCGAITRHSLGDGMHGAISPTGYHSVLGPDTAADNRRLLEDRHAELEKTLNSPKKKENPIAKCLGLFEKKVAGAHQEAIVAAANLIKDADDEAYTVYHAVQAAIDENNAWQALLLGTKLLGSTAPEIRAEAPKVEALWKEHLHAPASRGQSARFLAERILRRLRRKTEWKEEETLPTPEKEPEKAQTRVVQTELALF